MSANHVGRESEFEALGRKWKASRATRAVWERFLAWARPRIPDPLEVGKKALALFPEAMHQGVVQAALSAAGEYLSIGSPQVMRCLGSVEGMAQMLYLLLAPNHPEATEDLAFDIVMEQGQAAFQRTLAEAGGKVPPGAEGKGQAPAA